MHSPSLFFFATLSCNLFCKSFACKTKPNQNPQERRFCIYSTNKTSVKKLNLYFYLCLTQALLLYILYYIQQLYLDSLFLPTLLEELVHFLSEKHCVAVLQVSKLKYQLFVRFVINLNTGLCSNLSSVINVQTLSLHFSLNSASCCHIMHYLDQGSPTSDFLGHCPAGFPCFQHSWFK